MHFFTFTFFSSLPSGLFFIITSTVRIEPILIELEREQEDLLIIGHASVIRCLLAYLIGLPASEIPAIEIARGDLLEVVPASYGVHSHAFHFWDGPGRRGVGPDALDMLDVNNQRDVNNFYENYAESTKGKRKVAVEVQEMVEGINAQSSVSRSGSLSLAVENGNGVGIGEMIEPGKSLLRDDTPPSAVTPTPQSSLPKISSPPKVVIEEQVQ